MSLTIQSNALTTQDVLIPDMGILVPFGGGSVTVERDDLRLAADSDDLRTLTTDNAFGAGSHTLILLQNGAAVDPANVDAVLIAAPTSSGDPAVDFGGRPFFSSYMRQDTDDDYYKTAGYIDWPGAGVVSPVPTTLRVLISARSNNAQAKFRLMDVTNAVVLAEATVTAHRAVASFSAPITGVSSGAAVWSVAIQSPNDVTYVELWYVGVE